MPRKRRNTRRRRIEGLEDWQVEYLLTGKRPAKGEDGINPFKELIFVFARPGDPPCRHGDNLTWFQAWENFKNDPLIQQWRKENGKPYAEELLEEQD